MTSYTIGIIFDKRLEHIVLIKKKRPEWQKGLYNFPGGHQENGETMEECVSREIKEECDISIPVMDWKYIGIMQGLNFKVYILCAIWTRKHGILKVMTDEKCRWFHLELLPKNLVSNLKFLIPFALNCIKKTNTVVNFGKFYY